MHNKIQLILGSASPRRKELLQWTYIPFQIVTSNIEENSEKKDVGELVMDLAAQKARDVSRIILEMNSFSDPMILGADTIVVVDNTVLGKPKSRDDAKNMLMSLQGRKHKVLTGVCLLFRDKEYNFYDETIVEFDYITDDLLELYLNTGESMDKAGSYGIQGAALGFIGKINGSYSNVVGLPVNLVLKNIQKVLEEHGVDINEKIGTENWRNRFE